MLTLSFREGEVAVVFYEEQPIGVIQIRAAHGAAHRVTVDFGGGRSQFHVLRASVLVRLYGEEEAARLINRILAQ